MRDSTRLEPELRRAVVERPDSVVGVLLRLEGPVDPDRRAELEEAGLAIGTVAGPVATGRLRACDAPRVAGLEWVRYIELAREVPIPPSPDTPHP